MAKIVRENVTREVVTTVTEPAYVITLSEAEARGLRTILGALPAGTSRYAGTLDLFHTLSSMVAPHIRIHRGIEQRIRTYGTPDAEPYPSTENENG